MTAFVVCAHSEGGDENAQTMFKRPKVGLYQGVAMASVIAGVLSRHTPSSIACAEPLINNEDRLVEDEAHTHSVVRYVIVIWSIFPLR